MANRPSPTTDDETLAQQAASDRDSQVAPEAFRLLYERHARLLLAFLAARTPQSDVDDLHQAVWQRVWEHLPDQFHGGSFRGWLYQIARHLVIDHRRKKRPVALPEGELVDSRTALSPWLEQERHDALRGCLQWLDAEARVIVEARLGGQDYDAIAVRLGCLPARLHKLFHQAKAQLQACVQRALA